MHEPLRDPGLAIWTSRCKDSKDWIDVIEVASYELVRNVRRFAFRALLS